jgi:hypothetical protein
LKEHEAGVSVADLCRKHGVSRQHLRTASRGASHAERLHRELQRQLRDELLNETLFTSLAQSYGAQMLAG